MLALKNSWASRTHEEPVTSMMTSTMNKNQRMSFQRSDDEGYGDVYKRISMCVSIDRSERRLNLSNFRPSRHRNIGGGLFGTVDEQYAAESVMSIPVPNRFFAESQNFGHSKKKKALNSYYPENYEADYYERYNEGRTNTPPHRRFPVRSYDTQHRERTYNEPRVHKEYSERHRRKQYEERSREPMPEYDYRMAEYEQSERDRERKGRRRQDRHLAGYNNDYYNYDFPSRHTDNLYKTIDDFPIGKLRKSRNSNRRSSGCANMDYPEYHQQQDYYNVPQNYDTSHEYCDYETNPYQERNYYTEEEPRSIEYNEDDYYHSRGEQPTRKKSVDFLACNCEVPYNIRKSPGHSHRQNYKNPDRLSTVEIPYPRTQNIRQERQERQERQSDSNYNYKVADECCEPCCQYRRPGNKYKHTTHGFNPIARPSYMNTSEPNEKRHRKSLKEKISGFFKRSKSKSNMKGKHSKYSIRDNSKSLRSTSSVVVRKNHPKDTCSVYPTVYRESKGPTYRNEDMEEFTNEYSMNKIPGMCKCCSECSRQFTYQSTTNNNADKYDYAGEQNYRGQYLGSRDPEENHPQVRQNLQQGFAQCPESCCRCTNARPRQLATPRYPGRRHYDRENAHQIENPEYLESCIPCPGREKNLQFETSNCPDSCCTCSRKNNRQDGIPQCPESCCKYDRGKPVQLEIPKNHGNGSYSRYNPHQIDLPQYHENVAQPDTPAVRPSAINVCLTIFTDGKMREAPKMTTTQMEPSQFGSRTKGILAVTAAPPTNCCSNESLSCKCKYNTNCFRQNSKSNQKKVSVEEGLNKTWDSNNLALPIRSKTSINSKINPSKPREIPSKEMSGCYPTPFHNDIENNYNTVRFVPPRIISDNEIKGNEIGCEVTVIEETSPGLPRKEKSSSSKPKEANNNTKETEKSKNLEIDIPKKVELGCCANKPIWNIPDSSGNLSCPKLSHTYCDYRQSFVEELKRELLDSMLRDEQLNSQAQFMRPAPNIMLFPYVPEYPNCPYNPKSTNMDYSAQCWGPKKIHN